MKEKRKRKKKNRMIMIMMMMIVMIMIVMMVVVVVMMMMMMMMMVMVMVMVMVMMMMMNGGYNRAMEPSKRFVALYSWVRNLSVYIHHGMVVQCKNCLRSNLCTRILTTRCAAINFENPLHWNRFWNELRLFNNCSNHQLRNVTPSLLHCIKVLLLRCGCGSCMLCNFPSCLGPFYT